MQTAALFPIALSPSPRPTVVVVLPSPAGVGLIAVTKINFPCLMPFKDFIKFSESLALSCPKGIKSSSSIPSFNPICFIGNLVASLAISISVLIFSFLSLAEEGFLSFFFLF